MPMSSFVVTKAAAAAAEVSLCSMQNLSCLKQRQVCMHIALSEEDRKDFFSVQAIIFSVVQAHIYSSDLPTGVLEQRISLF